MRQEEPYFRNKPKKEAGNGCARGAGLTDDHKWKSIIFCTPVVDLTKLFWLLVFLISLSLRKPKFKRGKSQKFFLNFETFIKKTAKNTRTANLRPEFVQALMLKFLRQQQQQQQQQLRNGDFFLLNFDSHRNRFVLHVHCLKINKSRK